MNAKKCDRCGKLYEEKGDGHSEPFRYSVVKCCHPYEDRTLDLCSECKSELLKWLRERGAKW